MARLPSIMAKYAEQKPGSSHIFNRRKNMRSALVVLFLAASAFAQDQSAAVAAACGPKSTSFNVKRDESQHTLAQPESGKARVYFVQDIGIVECIGGCFTMKVGLDGTWVGANQHNSYFSVSVEPGEHHICANPQTRFQAGRLIALAHFTAEAGKVYYFRTRAFEDRNQMFLDLDPID